MRRLSYEEGKILGRLLGRHRSRSGPGLRERAAAQHRGFADQVLAGALPGRRAGKGRKYVMVLALHAGIPVHCLGDLLALINEHIVQGREASGAALLAWLDEPGKEYRANNLDMPVRNFFAYGAEFAVDILDRIIEFVVAPRTTIHSYSMPSSTRRRPGCRRVCSANSSDGSARHRCDGQVREEARSAGVEAHRHPRIQRRTMTRSSSVLALSGQAVRKSHGGVSIDGDVRNVHCCAPMGLECRSSLTRAVIDRPVRELVITHGPSGVSAVLGIVNREDPLLTFSVSWAVDPAARRPERRGLGRVSRRAPSSSTRPPGIRSRSQNEGSPAGWLGWKSAFVELTSVDGLQLQSQRTARSVPSVRCERMRVRGSNWASRCEACVPPTVATSSPTRPWVLLACHPIRPTTRRGGCARGAR